MATGHIIDEVVFDLSFDSIAIAREHESHISSWLTDQLLPIVDSILNTYDDAQTVLRMDHLELDLGDISSDDFYNEIIRKVSEQLTDQLRDARNSSPFEASSTENSSSAARPSPSLSPSSSPSPSIRQVSQAQSDSERLIDFLLTGNMAWHIDILATNVHEKMLAQVLQQTGESFVQFLQRSSAATRNVLIRRLVKQFSPQHLAVLLAKLAPTSARLILDLMIVIQSVSIQTQSDTTQPEELTEWLWMLTFETLLAEVQESDLQTAVIQKVFRKFEKLQMRVPDLIASKVIKIAENLSRKQKINTELPKILLDLINVDGKQLSNKDITNQIAPAPEALISNEIQIINNPLPPTVISSKQTKQDQIATSTAIYQRIVHAIANADIPGIDAKALMHGELADSAYPGEPAGSGEIRKQLLLLIQQAEMRVHFAEKLPERVLLDIVYLLSPQAAALTEQLLAQSTILFQATDATKKNSQSNVLEWQQQLWAGNLAALVTAQKKTLDPVDHLQALARWFSTTQEASAVMQAWYTALAKSKNYSTLYNMLQYLIVQQDQHLFNVGVNVDAEVSAESEPLVETPTKISESLAYQQLYQRLSATHSDKVITVDLQTVIDKLTTDSPAELRRIFQALRRGEFFLAAAKLQGAELRSLTTALIQMESSDIDEVQQDFIQAIECHAVQAKNQAIYYQRVLDALLQGDVVDLEAIALQRQYEPVSMPAPTTVSTISEKAHKASVPIKNLQTISTAIYQRIVQAIVKANIPDIDVKALAHGDLAELANPADPGEIRKQLLLLIQQAEIRAQLAEKLPERVLLDIIYLLSPHAAALTEQLLAQSTILFRVTDTTKQSSHSSHSSHSSQSSLSSVMAWQQQLWIGSLAVLNATQETNLDPAGYLQALARWFSTAHEAMTVMQAWYTALAKSKNYGTLYNMLQQLLVQQNQHLFNVGAEVSAESEPLVETLTRRSESPAYQQLYQRLSAAQSDKVVVDSQIVIEKLATDSPEELRRIFQALRCGELVLAAAKLQGAELRSLTTTLIQMESSDVDGFQQDFSKAIERHAEQAKDQVIYYQKVLDALLQGEIVDLEALVSQIPEERESGEKSEELMEVSESPAYQQLYQRLSATQSDKVETDDLQTVIDKLATDSPEELRRVFQALHRGELILAAAKLQGAELRSLTTALIQLESSDIGEVQQDFILAIERHAAQTKDQVIYYQKVLDALLQGEIVDLEALVSQIPEEPKSGEVLMEVSESPAYHQLYQRLSATQSDKVKTGDLQTVIDKLATDSPEELRRVFQALRRGELILAVAKLQGAELRSLTTALIQMESSNIDEVQQDFVRAIERHAAQAIDPTIYYQRILEALLQGDVVDIEAIALQRHYEPTSMPAPTTVSTISEKAQKSSDPIINFQTISTVIYKRILQAIAKANIPDIDVKALVHGELASLNDSADSTDPGEIRKQLLLLIQQAEMRMQLADKLPERVLLDIVYLLSPHAAAITEQLLAQSTTLFQATNTTKQSSVAAWQQQLWIGSLATLTAVQGSNLDPADYLQALIRRFSSSQDTAAVLQTWYTALAQSQKYGSLYNMLQQLIAQQDQHVLNVGANVGTEVSAESEPLVETLTKVLESPAYHQLYQRLSATQSDKVKTGDLQTVIDKLVTDSPEELRRIFQELCRGELTLTAANLKGVELQSLVIALIKTDSTKIGEVQQDFLQAIERYATQATDQVVYYQLVFEALLQGEVVDLEAFALKRVIENKMPVASQPNVADNISPDQEALESVVWVKKPALIILDDALGLSSEADVTEEIYINNAGQVLAAPYLPRLFSALKLMEDGDFVDRSAAERAVHLLQFMVNEQTQSPEYQLLLNKILCGITTDIPICREITISEQERAMIEDFIKGMIQNWKTIGETTISGLRQTFLQRKGRLQLKEGMWYLTIEPGTFDMLLDGLPWSFSVIKHAWMDRAIHVTWR